MFTGLVETMGTLTAQTPDGAGGSRLCIREATLAPQLVLGESVAVNGVCLTVVQITEAEFHFQAGPETLLKTNLGSLTPGEPVNLERSLRLSDRLGGHLVQGHVDARSQVAARQSLGEWEMVWFTCPTELMPQIAPKGSVAVDGVSLTVVAVEADRFQVMLIPHTLAVTTLGRRPVGSWVNLETDMLAKYVARQLAGFIARPG